MSLLSLPTGKHHYLGIYGMPDQQIRDGPIISYTTSPASPSGYQPGRVMNRPLWGQLQHRSEAMLREGMAPSPGKQRAHCVRDLPMALCSHQEERMGLEPRDTGRTGPTYDHSQSFTGEFCRVLSLRLWALQDEKPLFPKGACSHQGTRQGAH